MPQLLTPVPAQTSLRKPQIAVLTYLASQPEGVGFKRPVISETSGVAENTLCPVLGSLDAEMRKKAEIRGKMISLITLGYVEGWTVDIDGISEILYAITCTGRKALQAALSDHPV